jgi:hypothetical protein
MSSETSELSELSDFSEHARQAGARRAASRRTFRDWIHRQTGGLLFHIIFIFPYYTY